jgi:hypothetical protein
MGIEIKLTDREFPISAVFVDFLHRHIEGRTQEPTWFDQLSEDLIPAQSEERRQAAMAVVEAVVGHPAGQKAILRSYELLTDILTGQPEKLRYFQDLLRVRDLSGSVARQLSGRHSAPKGVPDETDGTATGDPEDEIRRSVRRMEHRAADAGRSGADLGDVRAQLPAVSCAVRGRGAGGADRPTAGAGLESSGASR